MLVSLHIKNFAIIDEVEVYFKEHLNIMTGETGAGKSIIIGSINAALGGKVSKDLLRSGAEYALIELVFETKDPAVLQVMEEHDLPIDDGQIIISKKIMANRSVSKINGENVTTPILSKIAGLLIDIHGQHEHQSLLYKSKHLEIVDRFAKNDIKNLKIEIEEAYRSYLKVKQEYEGATLEEEKRLREISFLEYEVNEIKSANLKIGEDEELSSLYKKLSSAKTIADGLQTVHQYTGYNTSSAGDSIGRALKHLMKISEYDDKIQEFADQVSAIEEMLNDLNRDLSQYITNIENPEDDLDEITKRLDLVNHMKNKYGNTIEGIHQYCKVCEEKLEKYMDYDTYLANLHKSLDHMTAVLEEKSETLSSIRKSKAVELTQKIREALYALNFLDVRFEMVFRKLGHYTFNGFDEGEFIISTNPGEDPRPLSKVASGGELSRIMLGIKAVLADKDEIETLIFDEIDVGISGRTAQKVSEQLAVIAKDHQIICITHLAQIAAMADTHFIIEKETDGFTTHTSIRRMEEEEAIDELSRILGGAEITDRVRDNAIEMKNLADRAKKYMN